jgi:hypothetical protein
VASDGGVFCFGDAQFYGSIGGQDPRAPVGGILPTASGRGYLLWGRDGSTYPFGDAPTLGSYRDLPAAAIDPPSGSNGSFVGATMPTGTTGYQLWAVTELGPPPAVRAYTFVPSA